MVDEMGMFDSLLIKCPKCGKEMEWQSKSGPCCLESYKPNRLPVAVAQDLKGDVLGCQFCNTNFKFILLDPPYAKFKIVKTKSKRNYWANHNPDHPETIKRQKEMAKMFGIKDNNNNKDKKNKGKKK